MTEAEILQWMRSLWPGPQVRASTWLFALGETVHFIGLSLLLGAMLIVDLRLMGFLRRIPVKAALAFLPFAIIGFILNAATGWEFFTADPKMYWPNPAFKLKLFLILLAGLNALIFTVMEHRHAITIGPGEDTTTFTKLTAGLSLSLWLIVLLLGRLLPSFEGSTSFFE